jgi:hypothetical protein
MLKYEEKYTEELQADAETKLIRMIDCNPLRQTQIEPTLYIAMTDKGIEVTLRF